MLYALPPPPHPSPAPLHILARPAPQVRRDPLEGLVIRLQLDEGRIDLLVNKDAEVAYIDATWPCNGNALLLAIQRVKFYGYVPIPEEDSPAEPIGNRVRIYLMEA